MFQHTAAPAYMGFQPSYYAPPPPSHMGALAPVRMGATPTPYRYYEIVGQEAPKEGMLDKIKAWGDTETLRMKRKYILLGAAIVGLAWYGYSAGWFGK